jgi:hypothetical protein
MSRLVGLLYMAGIVERKEEEKEKTEVPAHVTTFDPFSLLIFFLIPEPCKTILFTGSCPYEGIFFRQQ